LKQAMEVPSYPKAGTKTKISKGYQMKIGASEITDTVNVYAKYLTLKNYRYCKHISTPKSSRKVVISYCQSKI